MVVDETVGACGVVTGGTVTGGSVTVPDGAASVHAPSTTSSRPSKNPSIPRAAYARGSRDSVLLCLARLNEMVAFPQSAKAQL